MSVNQLNQVKTREEYKKIKDHERNSVVERPEAAKSQKAEKAQKRIRIRLIPIWLRLVLLVVMVAVSAIAGAAVGYGVLGGGSPGDVLKESTWTHIVDLIEKK